MQIKLDNIQKYYKVGKEKLHILKSLNLEIEEGEFIMIMCKSCSGKTTLLNVLGFLDKIDEGHYIFNDTDVSTLSENKRSEYRAKYAGFVFQQFFLLSKLNALQNVELPLIYAGVGLSKRKSLAEQFLTKVELDTRMHHLPSELSGGQKQRVAIARALVNNPSLILADEPTGALDTKTGEQIMELLTELNREGKTIIMVTHEPEIAAYAKRQIVIRDGVISSDSAKEGGLV